MYEIRQHKTEIREYYLEKKRALTPEQKGELDKKLCDAIIASATFRYAETLLMYYPKEDEVDINAVALAALAQGKRIAYPKSDPEDRSMIFSFVSSFDDLEVGTYGIMEPKPGLEHFEVTGSLQKNVICIIPAVVYDKKGFRIGYGGGYYDRYLSQFKGTKVGVQYHDYIVNMVPHGRFDLAADVIITERGIYPKKT
ncbi:MAG: 5-formyltetrahydrofolate cyclo-ligase [Clostridia bacterium]|nr:5-formyltetrahydrofolate cyclo-ligase [Clostridia bacterium]